jgi:hypothetical protein
MLITKRSLLTNLNHTRDVPVTDEELLEWEESGRPIQIALSFLSAEDREFLQTGITPEEWDHAFMD